MQLCPVRGQCCGGGGWPDHLQVFKFNQRKVMSTYFVTNQSANVNLKEVKAILQRNANACGISDICLGWCVVLGT